MKMEMWWKRWWKKHLWVVCSSTSMCPKKWGMSTPSSPRSPSATSSALLSSVAVWFAPLNSWMTSKTSVTIWHSRAACRLTSVTCLCPKKRLSMWRKVTSKWKKWWLTTIWVSSPTTNATIKSLIFGHTSTRSWPALWWSKFRQPTKALTRFSWCSIPVLVVLRTRFVSLPVCVVLWQSLKRAVPKAVKSSKTRFWQTLKKAFRCWNTLSQPTVLVRVLPIPHWKPPTQVILLVVLSMWHTTWLSPKKIAAHSVAWFAPSLKTTKTLWLRSANVSSDVSQCMISLTRKQGRWLWQAVKKSTMPLPNASKIRPLSK